MVGDEWGWAVAENLHGSVHESVLKSVHLSGRVLFSPALLLDQSILLGFGQLSGTESAILNRESSDSESCNSNRAIPRSLEALIGCDQIQMAIL